MARKETPWLALIKKKNKEVLAEGKLKGAAALTEAMKRAKKVYIKVKKTTAGGPKEYKEGKWGRKIRSAGLGRGEGHGKGKGPIGRPVKL